MACPPSFSGIGECLVALNITYAHSALGKIDRNLLLWRYLLSPLVTGILSRCTDLGELATKQIYATSNSVSYAQNHTFQIPEAVSCRDFQLITLFAPKPFPFVQLCCIRFC